MSQDAQPADARREAAARQLQLLWQPPEPPARGPRRSSTLQDVVSAAVRVADAGGLEAMSMRRVAGELGIGAMSIYTYVPGRDELLELMIDRVSAEMQAPDPQAAWREQVASWARQRRAMVVRHGWMVDASTWRDVLGPNAMMVSETLFAALLRSGLSERDVGATANAVRWFVDGAASVVVGEQTVTRRTGQTAEDYYQAREGFWSTWFQYERYPAHVQLWEAGAFDDAAGYDFERNLRDLLDGIEVRASP